MSFEVLYHLKKCTKMESMEFTNAAGKGGSEGWGGGAEEEATRSGEMSS